MDPKHSEYQGIARYKLENRKTSVISFFRCDILLPYCSTIESLILNCQETKLTLQAITYSQDIFIEFENSTLGGNFCAIVFRENESYYLLCGNMLPNIKLAFTAHFSAPIFHQSTFSMIQIRASKSTRCIFPIYRVCINLLDWAHYTFSVDHSGVTQNLRPASAFAFYCRPTSRFCFTFSSLTQIVSPLPTSKRQYVILLDESQITSPSLANVLKRLDFQENITIVLYGAQLRYLQSTNNLIRIINFLSSPSIAGESSFLDAYTIYSENRKTGPYHVLAIGAHFTPTSIDIAQDEMIYYLDLQVSADFRPYHNQFFVPVTSAERIIESISLVFTDTLATARPPMLKDFSPTVQVAAIPQLPVPNAKPNATSLITVLDSNVSVQTENPIHVDLSFDRNYSLAPSVPIYQPISHDSTGAVFDSVLQQPNFDKQEDTGKPLPRLSPPSSRPTTPIATAIEPTTDQPEQSSEETPSTNTPATSDAHPREQETRNSDSARVAETEVISSSDSTDDSGPRETPKHKSVPRERSARKSLRKSAGRKYIKQRCRSPKSNCYNRKDEISKHDCLASKSSCFDLKKGISRIDSSLLEDYITDDFTNGRSRNSLVALGTLVATCLRAAHDRAAKQISAILAILLSQNSHSSHSSYNREGHVTQYRKHDILERVSLRKTDMNQMVNEFELGRFGLESSKRGEAVVRLDDNYDMEIILEAQEMRIKTHITMFLKLSPKLIRKTIKTFAADYDSALNQHIKFTDIMRLRHSSLADDSHSLRDPINSILALNYNMFRKSYPTEDAFWEEFMQQTAQIDVAEWLGTKRISPRLQIAVYSRRKALGRFYKTDGNKVPREVRKVLFEDIYARFAVYNPLQALAEFDTKEPEKERLKYGWIYNQRETVECMAKYLKLSREEDLHEMHVADFSGSEDIFSASMSCEKDIFDSPDWDGKKEFARDGKYLEFVKRILRKGQLESIGPPECHKKARSIVTKSKLFECALCRSMPENAQERAVVRYWASEIADLSFLKPAEIERWGREFEAVIKSIPNDLMRDPDESERPESDITLRERVILNIEFLIEQTGRAATCGSQIFADSTEFIEMTGHLFELFHQITGKKPFSCYNEELLSQGRPFVITPPGATSTPVEDNDYLRRSGDGDIHSTNGVTITTPLKPPPRPPAPVLLKQTRLGFDSSKFR